MATALSEAGANVLLVGGRQDRLEAVLGQRQGSVFATDLSQNRAATQLAEAVSKAGFSPETGLSFAATLIIWVAIKDAYSC